MSAKQEPPLGRESDRESPGFSRGEDVESAVRSDRPEVTVLTDEQRSRVLEQLRHTRSACRGCGAGDYRVGDALYLGFLFRRERTDAYMIALTCTNPACPAPHNGVRYHASEWPTP